MYLSSGMTVEALEEEHRVLHEYRDTGEEVYAAVVQSVNRFISFVRAQKRQYWMTSWR